MRMSHLAAALLLASASSAALSDVPEQTQGVYNFYIGAMFNNTDNARQNVDNGYGVIGALGIPITSWGERWSVELAANGATLKTNNTQDTNYFRQAYTGSLMYSFGDRDEFTPYVLAGGGYVHNDTNFLDEDGATAHVGLGFTKLIGKTVRGRMEI
ncbi:MAG: outer membrane beta-barrel protein, partial [Paraperlucidibaca sp.]